MRPLILDDAFKSEIKRVREYAEAHPKSIHDVMRILKGNDKPPGDDPHFTCYLDFGFRAVFTIEQQAIGTIRHLSVSVTRKGKFPNEQAVKLIALEFGFRDEFEKWHKFLEEDVQAVNVMELIKPV